MMNNKVIKGKIILIIILVFTCIFTVACSSINKEQPKLKKGFLDLSGWDFKQDGLVELDGEWEFYFHQLYEPEDFRIGKVKECRYINVPGLVSKQMIEGKNLPNFGYLTLRSRIKLNDKSEDLGLKTQGILTAANIYVDGKLLNSYGKVGKNEETSRSIFSTTISYFENEDDNIEIVIQASNFEDLSSAIKIMYLGTQEQIIKKSNIQLSVDVFLFGSIVIMAFYHFVLFLMRKKDRSTLYFGLFSVIIAWRELFVRERLLVQLFSNMSYEFLSKNAAITYHLAVPCFVMFLKEIFPSISNKVVRLSQIAGVAFTILCLITRSRIYDRVAIPSQIITALIIMYLMYKLFHELKNNKLGALIILFGASALFITALCDILGYHSLLPSNYSVPYGLFIFIISQSYMIAVRFSKSFSRIENLAFENENMYQQIKRLNEGLEKKVEERTASVKNLFNNAGQGFLSFGKDLLIDKEYSLECKKIFGRNIENVGFVDLICLNNDNKEFLVNVFNDIFNMEDDMTEVYMSLLPEEIKINNKEISIEYKIIKDISYAKEIKIMVVLTDISETKELEDKMKNERNTLRMIVSTVVNYNDFVDHIKDYEQFCKIQIYNMVKDSNLRDNLMGIYRKVHTFKGIFSQFEMIHTVDKLHNFETQLSNITNGEDREIKDFIESLHKKDLYSWVEKDMEILHKVLGENYFKKDKICIVNEEKLKIIEKRIIELFPSEEAEEILSLIRSIRYRSVKKIINSYSGYVLRLAEKIEKPIHFNISGDEIYIDKEKYKDFFKMLVHVFRNCLDHGIESMDERVLKGKELNGNILCNIKNCKDSILISIKDDGRGIDYDKIRSEAIMRGIIDEKLPVTKEVIIDLIFEECFSTRKEASEISGRGMGLSEVKNIVNKLGGRIEVETEKNKGTIFNFYIPRL